MHLAHLLLQRLTELLPPSWSEKARSLKLNPRIIDYEPITKIKAIKANVIGIVVVCLFATAYLCLSPHVTMLPPFSISIAGKFICVRGTVVRVSNIKPMVTRMDFTCQRCEATICVWLMDGKYATPTKCSNAECKSKSYVGCAGGEERIDEFYSL